MEDEQKEQTTPPRFKGKLFKFLTIGLFFIVAFFALGLVGVETTSSSSFCSSCHEMQPEFYTWKASTHSEVDCVQCHIQSGVENYSKAKANGLVQVYKKQTNTYTAPIRMPDEIPDSSCEKCHNIKTRNFTVSGDIIIPHDKHKDKEIECIQCHSGIAHGKVADRKMTFQSDYQKWDETTGKTAMKDTKFIKPDMETCIDCHKARKITTECSACHSTGMVPEGHKKADFKTKTHGILAGKELETCNECHKLMSKDKLEGFEEASVLDKYISSNRQSTKKNQYDYAKDNTFCSDCHIKRPASHESGFISKHGALANKDLNSCKACHDIQQTPVSNKNKVNCSSCHQSSHSKKNPRWRENHKIPIAPNQKPSDFCYSCHVKDRCTSCHKN
jgi:nitrate/TMAO reductase-like tetraheme cytochrome c subunit